ARIDRLAEKHLTRYRRRSVGFIFQFHYLLNDFTALENVMLPAYIAGLSKKAAVAAARALLADVNMDTRADHLPQQLSGGERQRVAVARSMVNDPAVILADEPTGNLDKENAALVTRLLYESAEKRGKTLIVVTHDEAVAARASRRFTLADGSLSETQN
ncbi:MAG: ATP-binding cassette domain-containing protein, partial [Spirochaetaceae bacterium]|nr:ATP-binding cassette domain-containing protein [Spirochaetaceae bacterium]